MQSISVSDSYVALWIRRALAADPPRAKSLIVTVWGDALAPHGGGVWLTGLIRLLAPFDHQRAAGPHQRIPPRRRRLASARLAGPPQPLSPDARGRASLSRRVQAHLRAPRRRLARRLGARARGRVAAPRRLGLRQELAWAGFGELGTTTFLRPHEAARALPSILDAKGIASSVTVAIGADFAGRPIAQAVPEAWDSGVARFRLPAIPGALRRRHRALSRRRRA